MTEPCPLHAISPRLCGCHADTLRPPRPDSRRVFSELEVGRRVRFAGQIRDVVECERCGHPGVLLEDPRAREVPVSDGNGAVWSERRRLKQVVHDALVGEGGYEVVEACRWYEAAGKRKKR